MLRTLFKFLSVASIMAFSLESMGENADVLSNYNSKLPIWGVSWKPGRNAINGYYPSFYTGFAPRMQNPERIHIRLSRGNQTRASLILDENTIFDFLYDLKKRSEFYTEMVQEGYIDVDPSGSKLEQHVSHFQKAVESGILKPIELFNAGSITKEELYSLSLDAIKTLNAGRVFEIEVDLAREFLDWRNSKILGDYSDVNLQSSSQSAMVLTNLMVLGRINLTRELNQAEISMLKNLVTGASVLSDEGFVLAAYLFFESVTGGKYDFKRLNKDSDALVAAKGCESLENCKLVYPEFTAIYPTGSLKSSVKDRRGNRISRYATPGLHAFIDTGSRGDVDNIRRESYYGFAPKMDYEGIGNGFHNPAVRLFPGKSVKKAMRIDPEHTTYWPVKRGSVSSGCSRLPLGHVWEMRHLFPVQNSLMTQVYYFGNDSRDFDLYDVDGDGAPEVMGVKYYIQYGTKGSSGLAKREGEGLSLNENVLNFFNSLYGSRGVFNETESGIMIYDPVISVQTANDRWTGSRSKGKVISSHSHQGAFPLYEQNYEQDKVQFYTSTKVRGFNDSLSRRGAETLGKRFVRLMGRVRGCAPFSDKGACGENAFEDEKRKILEEI